jgi:hypothetical protein
MRASIRLTLFCLLLAPVGVLTQSAVPTPASVFGFEPGADDMLATYEQVLDYYRRVDAASDYVTLVDAGETSQGRRAYFALVSSPDNLRNIDRLREIQQRLAHPDGLSDADARALAAEGKAFVHVDGGLHSTEVAAPQHTPLLLHNLVARAAEPAVARMLDDVVVMLWPTINPDGHQMVAERQARVNAGDTRPLGQLYQAYVGHDNNRDAYMLNMVESRMLEHAWRLWEPNVIYVHHQSAPFPTRIWLPPFADPIATHAPYIMSREVNMIGMAIAKGLEERGQVGATHMGTGYDAWYPGYIDYLPMFKNVAAFWTETQGSGASPRVSAPEDVREDMRRPQPLYASPWLGGTWRLRDAVEYMETASWSVIDYASRYKDVLLMNRYRSGIDQIAAGRAAPPYAFIIPQNQRDPAAAVELLRRLAFAGVRVYQYREESTVNGLRYPGGTWVVPTDQEFAALVREVLEVQEYPEIRSSSDGPLDQPYDAAGWTLGLAMGVDVIEADWLINYEGLDPVTREAPITQPVTPYDSSSVDDAAPFDSVPGLGFDSHPAARAIVPPAGRITGAGPALAVDPKENNAFKAVNEAWAAGATVTFVPGSTPDDARYVITGLPAADQERLVASLALSAERTTAPAAPGARRRVGLFDVPTSMDHGWTRWVLERYAFEIVPVTGEDIEAGSLGDRVDVLLVTDEARGILAGGGRGGRRGGGGGAGGGAGGAPQANPGNDARIASIRAFVEGGGTLVCFNRSSGFAIDELDLPVSNAVQVVFRDDFAVNGSLLRVTTDPSQRVMAGMPGEAAIFYDRGPVFEIEPGANVNVLARYQDEGSPLLSGFLLGEQYLQGKAAAVEVPLGAGHVVLLGFRPQWRAQTFGTFRVIFNAAMR